MNARSRLVKLVVRPAIAVAGLAAMLWASSVIPTFWSEAALTNVAKAIMAGEAFKSSVLAAVDQPGEDGWPRANALSNLAMVRLRRLEDAMRAGDSGRIDEALAVAARTNDAALAQNPSNSFLWLARFWLANTRSGLSNGHLAYLRMSYDVGRNEGWVSVKRNRFALAVYSVLPEDIAELSISEFTSLVRWGLVAEAAEIAAGPATPLRGKLFPRLRDLPNEQRRAFAQRIYQMEIDDVPVPGIDPPKPQVPLPVFPPGHGDCHAC